MVRKRDRIKSGFKKIRLKVEGKKRKIIIFTGTAPMYTSCMVYVDSYGDVGVGYSNVRQYCTQYGGSYLQFGYTYSSTSQTTTTSVSSSTSYYRNIPSLESEKPKVEIVGDIKAFCDSDLPVLIGKKDFDYKGSNFENTDDPELEEEIYQILMSKEFQDDLEASCVRDLYEKVPIPKSGVNTRWMGYSGC